MKIKVTKSFSPKNDVIVYFMSEENVKNAEKFFTKDLYTGLKDIIKNEDFCGKEGEILNSYVLYGGAKVKVCLFGIGKEKDIEENTYRNVAGLIGKSLRTKTKKVFVDLLDLNEEKSLSFLEGFLYSMYKFETFKTEKKAVTIDTLTILTINTSKEFLKKVELVENIVKGADFIRELVNLPSNVVNSKYISSEVKKTAKTCGYLVDVIGEKEMEKEGWGALLAVNQGSNKEAMCLVMKYMGAKSKSEKPTILVGKAVTFDTGGYNLKPTGAIETMHQDMAGGATVIGIMTALKDLNIKKNVIGIVPIVENMISANSYKPSDIIKSLSGKTIEITNTDAEGRLILADAIHYATTLKPKEIISIATLTGAAMVALGDRYTALLSNKKELSNAIMEAGNKVDDLGWELPIHKDYCTKVKSKIADLQNYDTASGKLAGTAKAAAFLKEFIGDNDWCHLDIAGTAYVDDPKPYQERGAVAGGYRMLIEYLKDSE